MGRLPAKFTQDDIHRAVKAAAGIGWRVRITQAGEILIEPREPEQLPVDERPSYAF